MDTKSDAAVIPWPRFPDVPAHVLRRDEGVPLSAPGVTRGGWRAWQAFRLGADPARTAPSAVHAAG